MITLVAEGMMEVLRFFVFSLLWNVVLFAIGRGALLLVGKRVSTHASQREHNRVSLLGTGVVVLIWCALAIYNNIAG